MAIQVVPEEVFEALYVSDTKLRLLSEEYTDVVSKLNLSFANRLQDLQLTLKKLDESN
jgi:hypothetical protein